MQNSCVPSGKERNVRVKNTTHVHNTTTTNTNNNHSLLMSLRVDALKSQASEAH